MGSISLNEKTSKYLRLNISGTKFELLKRIISAGGAAIDDGEKSILEQLIETPENRSICDDYCSENDTYFFSRSPKIFDSILDYYRSGQVHKPTELCWDRFLSEVKFWKIQPENICKTCAESLPKPPPDSDVDRDNSHMTSSGATPTNDVICKRSNHSPLCNHVMVSSPPIEEAEEAQSDVEDENFPEFQGIKGGKFREKLWIFLEYPNSSVFAKIYCIFSIAIVLLSVLTLILGSVPELQNSDGEPLPVLWVIEDVCVAWFTFEFLGRLLVTPERVKFMKTPSNVVDILAIVPFYLELVLLVSGLWNKNMKNIASLMLTLRIMRIFRVARVFKLARYSDHLRHFGESVRASKQEFGMLILYMSISVLLFSTSVYYLEKEDPNSQFESIPVAFWWCIVTMTTVGYGDLIPITIGGKLVASLTTISGVIVLAYPITMIVNNFNRLYNRKPTFEQLHKKLSKTPSAHPGGESEKQENPLKVHSIAIL